MTAGRPGVYTTHRYTSEDTAKRWWPRRPLCLASPRQPPSTRREEKDDRTFYQSFSLVRRPSPDAAAEGTEKLNCGNPSEEKTSPTGLARVENETQCWSGLM
jgi:hypothetical protein